MYFQNYKQTCKVIETVYNIILDLKCECIKRIKTVHTENK